MLNQHQLGFSLKAVTIKSLRMFLLESDDRHGGIMFEILPAPPSPLNIQKGAAHDFLAGCLKMV